jgi:hypothetical protein
MRPANIVVLLASAAIALASAAPAFAFHRNQLVVTVDKPVAVLVDGQVLDYVEGSTRCELHEVTPGKHLVEIRNLVGKLLAAGEVVFPGDSEAIVRAKYSGGAFSVYDTTFLAPEPGPGTTTVVVAGGAGGPLATASVSTTTSSSSTTTTVSSDGVMVGVGLGGLGLGGTGSVSVTTTETTTTTTGGGGGYGGGSVIVTEQVPASRRVTFRSTDGEWGSVYVDGKKVWEIRAGAQEKAITLSTGEHTVEIKDFMENETWCKGRLVVDGRTDLVVGLAEGQQPEVYNDSRAWRP